MKKDKKKKELKNNDINNNDSMEEEKNNDSKKEENTDTIAKDEKFDTLRFSAKVIAFVVLIVFGIIILVNKEIAIFSLFLVIGGIAVFAAIIRFILLFVKGVDNSKIKKIKLIIIIIHVAVGLYMIIAGLAYHDDPNSKFSNFNSKYLALYFAVILYSQALAYLMNTVLYREKTTPFMFWLHIGFISFGAIILALASGILSDGDKFDTKNIIYTLAVAIFIAAAIIGVEATISFIKYKKRINKTKEEDKKEDLNVIDAETFDVVENNNQALIENNNVIDADVNEDNNEETKEEDNKEDESDE